LSDAQSLSGGTPEPGERRVAVVGGGLAGLAAAYELGERAAAAGIPLRCHVIEADGRFGGKIATSRVEGLVIEAGADSMLSAKPQALEWCRRLGLMDRVVNTRTEDRRTFVWSRGRLRELPEGLVLGSPARAGALLRSGLLSPQGAARMALDVAVPARRDGAEESLASFFTRRLGREAFERVVEPLLAGIHAGDATRLSLEATFPRFAEMEREHGGLVRATLAARRPGGPGAPAAAGPAGRAAPAAPAAGTTPSGRTPFVSLETGLAELTEALVDRLRQSGAELMAGCRVTAVRAGRPGADAGPGREGGGYEVVLESGTALAVDAVVLATPAPVTARLLANLCPLAAGLLQSIPHASTATVSLAYSDLDRSPEGYGFVVPRVEQRDLIAATWSSQKWPGRAPPGQVLVRGYVGGTGREWVLEADDDSLIRLVRAELSSMAGIAGRPFHAEVHRYPEGMPQYTVGHRARVERIRAELVGWPALAVTGAAYGGVGIPDCIADATGTAGTVLAALAAGR
jgi:protoporphyrinogen/coproporphyrinogen III oxidase